MSRTDTMPATSPSSSTTRCRKPPLVIASAAWSSVQLGAAKSRSAVRWAATRSPSGSWPVPSDSSTSRSVMMPMPEPSGSCTTAAPTRREIIERLASRSVCPGPICSTVVLIASRTCMGAHLLVHGFGPSSSADPPATRAGPAPAAILGRVTADATTAVPVGAPVAARAPALAPAREPAMGPALAPLPAPLTAPALGAVASRARRWVSVLRHPALPAPVTLLWVPLVLLLDGGAGLAEQRALGAGTWVLLLALLRREAPLVRAQVAVVVLFATAVEYTFSPLLEVYVYRLHNVPAFVPPGHGLVYLCALAIGRAAFVHSRRRLLVSLTVVVGGGYAVWGLLLSGRPDVLGALWFLCLLGFLCWGRSRLLYVGAFVVVTYLELLGTQLGTWTWQTHDPTGLVAIGNPPSGAAGGYGWFDLAAVLGAPVLLRTVQTFKKPRAEACSSPLDANALPPAGPGVPVRSVN